ncbi:family 16 glycosylhydrolase [Flavobacteriaceae bacterium]|nr:family 16 glycosylhydrolase [Flavobacteriaceae bacterium]
MRTLQTLLALLFLGTFSFAQQMPIDFSDPAENFLSFLGSSFSFNTDPEDSANDVGQFSNSSSNRWEGFYLDLSRAIDLDFQNTISLSFYSFDTNAHTVLLKLENGVNPDVEVTQSISSGSGWSNNVVFDFSQAVLSSDGVTPVNATGEYNRLVLFIDGGVFSGGTYFIDNIDDGSTEIDIPEVDVEYTNLVWEDQFDTPGVVDPSKWHHQTQVIIPGVGWANGEEQHYTNRLDNSFVDASGFLNIVAKQEIYTDQGLTKNYTSARLNSKFAFTYGRVDVRAKIPVGAGTWPAIWTLGKNINENGAYWDSQYGTTSWPACGEIDMMEHGIFPTEDINYIKSSLHTPCCYAGNPNGGGTIASDLENEFHVYSLNWSPDEITFLLDGVSFYTYNPAVKDNSTWPFIEDQFLLLNLAMGGIAGNISSGFDQATMLIDYVKVYQEGGCNGSSTSWDGSSWSNGIPQSNTLAIIEGPYNTTLGSLDACALQVDSSLTIAANTYIKIDGDINIKSSGSLTVAHTGSVVQTQDAVTVTNNGTISVLVDTPTLDVLDFMIMGSPMSSDTREGVWSTAWNVQDHTTSNFNSIAGITGFNFQDAELDDWNLYVTGTLDAGEGFLVRPQDSYNGAGGIFNYDFNTGTLNTGVITQPLGFNVTELESPNILSNPYASAIDADALLAANPEFDALYFWEHNLAPSPDYPGANTNGNNNYSMDDVSVYNALGGTAATSGGAVPNGVISTAQGFGVFATAAGTATFNNGMRLATGNTTLRNNTLSRDRLWLSVTSSAYGLSGNTLIGFIDGATPGVDNKYDNGRVASKVSLYSHIQGSDRGYSIQGREAFDNTMTVSLGFSSIIEEVTSYKISLSDFDGEAWLDATPYLIDNLAGVVTNLMEDSYSFTSDMGQYNDRFVVVFQDRSLGSQQVLASSISMYPNPANDVVTIASPTAAITLVEIRDIRGRLIQKQAVSGQRVAALNVASLDSAIYLVTIATDRGSITKKLIIR